MSKEKLYKYLKDNGNKFSLKLGEFLVVENIGEGGNGVVYKTTINGYCVAIKCLVSNTTGKTFKGKLDRFRAEYFNIATISNSANIVKYIDYDSIIIQEETRDIEIPCILMKCYDSSLKNNIEVFDEVEFKNLFNFLLDTVENIHKSGIIHRDIKPENILKEEDGLILADFGIASYNPEVFKIRAETRAGERLGNRLFSAPEQENPNEIPAKTMDVYAIGQVLQWFATGKTHRGTGRQSIPLESEYLKIIDRIIDICLSNNPKDRFQSIPEIREYIKHHSRKDPFDLLLDFNKLCRKCFPKNPYGLVYSNELNKIDFIFAQMQIALNMKIFQNTLMWYNGSSDFYFELQKKGDGVWKFNETEFVIKEIWVNYDSTGLNDFILIHHVPNTPFSIDGKETYNTAIVDNEHYISYEEYENGYAEINGEIIDLSGHNVEFIDREKKDGYFFICNRYHCLYHSDNSIQTRSFIEKTQCDVSDIQKDIEEFTREIRWNKHPYIESNL